MLRLLVTHGEHLGTTSVESKDRLGRTVLHLAAMHGCTELVKELMQPEAEGGFGAVLFALDLEGDMPIHLAIDFHRKGAFCAILEKVLEEFGVGD